MNGLRTVSFEALAEYIDLASGDPDVFMKLLLERNQISDKGKPCFLIQRQELTEVDCVKMIDAYAQELEERMS